MVRVCKHARAMGCVFERWAACLCKTAHCCQRSQLAAPLPGARRLINNTIPTHRPSRDGTRRHHVHLSHRSLRFLSGGLGGSSMQQRAGVRASAASSARRAGTQRRQRASDLLTPSTSTLRAPMYGAYIPIASLYLQLSFSSNNVSSSSTEDL